MTEREEQAREDAQVALYARDRRDVFARLWRQAGPTEQAQIARRVRLGLAWLRRQGQDEPQP